MTSNGVSGGVKRPLADSAFLIFAFSTTVLTGGLVWLIKLSGQLWLVALIPVVPALVALVLAVTRNETDQLKQLIRSLTNFRVGPRWLAVSVLAIPAVALVALAIYALTGDSEIRFGDPRFAVALAALPLAICHEFGWRGYAALHLARRKGLFMRSIIIGVVWFISVAPVYLFQTTLPGDIASYQLVLALIPLSTLMFWVLANTKSLLMPAVMIASGVVTISLLPILPGDSAQGVTFWLLIGFLWIAAVGVAGYYGTDGLDGSIHELPADELPVDWEKIMPRAGKGGKGGSRSGGRQGGDGPRKFSSVGRRVKR